MSRLVVADRRIVDPREVIFPDFASHPDALPRSPSPWDLEFEGPNLAGGKVIDAGVAFTYDVGKTIPSMLYFASPGGGAHTPGFYWPTPPTPFTMIAKIGAITWTGRSGTGPGISDVGSVMLGENPPGAMLHGILDSADNGFLTPCCSKWSSPTVFVTNVGDSPFVVGGTASGSGVRVAGFALARPHWVKYVVRSTTDLDCYFSFDGRAWTKLLTAYNPGFTIGAFGIDPHGGDCAYDYIRFTRP